MSMAKIKVEKTLPINPDKSGSVPSLTRDQVWEGLLLKVYDARPFVPLMTRCEVTEELENGIVREIIFDNMPLKERIILYPKEKIEFIRVGFGEEMGSIWNVILEEGGELFMQFAFELEVANLTDQELNEYEEKRAIGYLHAVQASIDHIRKLTDEKKQ